MSSDRQALVAELVSWFVARGGTLIVQRNGVLAVYSGEIHLHGEATGDDRMETLLRLLSDARAKVEEGS